MMTAMNDNHAMPHGATSAVSTDPSDYDQFYGGGVTPPSATLWGELSGLWLAATRERLERAVIAARLTGV
jgi:hypothetical protein